MKLLRSEAEFFAWMRDEMIFDNQDDDALRVYGPSLYPCYGFVGNADWDFEAYYPDYLYEADVSDMLTALHRAKNSTRENG